MSTTLSHREQRFVLNGVDWSAYEALLQAVGDQRVFVTYDRGRLELDRSALTDEISWAADVRGIVRAKLSQGS